MKKLYICEYPYVLYKTLIERMGDGENSYSLILGNSRTNFGPMVPILRQSGLFERVEYFPSEPYKDLYDLISFDRPRKTSIWMKDYPRVLYYLKKFKEISFPFELDFKQYDKIINSDGVYVINGFLNMNRIEYALSEHAEDALCKVGWQEQYYHIFLFLSAILDKLHIIIAPGPVAGFCKEIIVNDATNVGWPFRCKKATTWNVDEHIEALDARQKDRIFQLYAEGYGLKIDANQTYDLLLTTPLYGDSYLPSEESQVKFYQDVIRDNFIHPVLIKPHPRDKVDYKKYFPECTVIYEAIPSEILSFSQSLKLGTVLTVISSSAPAFRERAERVIILESHGTPISQMTSLEAYR